jgi:tRNA threonylcarbamoyladenosine biosynthesis protein TsaB
LILSLETSGNVCSVAVHVDGHLAVSEELREKQAHASKLAILIKQLLDSNEVQGKSMSAVAVSSGPGSYTGLRIGTSTAKGICYALSVPLIAVGSLELLSFQASKEFNDMSLCPMIDARRMEVYAMLINSEGRIIHHVEARIIDRYSYQDYLQKNRVVLFGDGAAKCKESIKNTKAFFGEKIHSTAKALGELWWE